MKRRDTGPRPSIKNTFNRRARKPSRLKRFLVYAAMIVGINTALNIDDYQMQWLKDRFIDAGARDELTVGERVALGRYVPPGANARHIEKFREFGYDERTNVPPGDARSPRMQEALIDAMPGNDNVHLEKLRELSLAEAEAYANRLIADENFMREFKRLDGLEQLEFGAAILFALRNGGMTDAEQEFQSWFVNTYEAPRSYQSWLDRQMNDLSDELAQDAVLRDNLSRWAPRYTYNDVPHAEEQFTLRHAALQRIADKVLEKFGYEPVPVFLSVNGRDLDPNLDPEDLKTTLGFFSFAMSITGGEFIMVNYFDPSVEMSTGSTLSDTKSALKTILEEAKHATDVFTVHDVFAGRIGRDDPRYAHGLALYINYSGGYNEVKHVNVPLLGKIPLGASDYTDQYVERTAKNFARAVRDALEEKRKAPLKKPAGKTPSPAPMS